MRKLRIAALSLIAISMISCTPKNDATPSDADSALPTINEDTTNTATNTATVADTATAGKADTAANQGTTAPAKPTATPKPKAEDLWPNDIVKAMKQYLGGKVVPHTKFYEKSRYLEAKWDASESKLLITGGYDYADSYVAQAKKDYDDAGWTTSESTSKVMKATDPTDSTLEVEVREGTYSEDESGYMVMAITYTEPFDATLFKAWPKEITDEFDAVLDKHKLPVIYLGTANPTLETVSSYADYKLEIKGGKWNDQVTALAKTALQGDTADGKDNKAWTVNDAPTSSDYDLFSSYYIDDASKGLIATKTFTDDCIITLELAESSGKAVIRCDIKIGFNSARATGSWSQDVKDEMNTNLDNHADDIPYVYLGSDTLTTYWSSSYKYLEIKAEDIDWDDAIITDPTYGATAQFTKAGGWTTSVITKTSSTEGDSDNFKAEKTMDDGCKFSVLIYHSSSYYDGGVRMRISFEKGWQVPTTWKDYTDATKTLLSTYLSPHETAVPKVYLGTATDTAAWDATTSTLTITGGTWANAVKDYAKNVIQNFVVPTTAGAKATSYTVADKTFGYGGVSSYKDSGYYYDYTGLEAKLEFNDGSNFTIDIKTDLVPTNSRDYKDAIDTAHAVMAIQYFKPYNPADGSGAWSTAVQNEFKTDGHLKGTSIPYVYLNSDAAETAAWDDDTWVLTITGGLWDDGMVAAATTAFTSVTGQTWTKHEDPLNTDGYNPYSKGFSASMTDATTKAKVSLTLASSAANKGSAVMKVTYRMAYDASKESGSFDAATLKSLNAALDNHGSEIPYIYLNTGDEQPAGKEITDTEYDYDTYTSTKKTVGYQFTGGFMVDEVLSNARTKLNGKDFTVSDLAKDEDASYSDPNRYGDAIVATKSIKDDGCIITVTIYQNEKGKIIVTYKWEEGYNASNGLGHWGSKAEVDALTATDTETATEKNIKAQLGEDLPYFYIGAKEPKTTIGSAYVTIEGAVDFKTDIINQAKAQYTTAKGWTEYDDIHYASGMSSYSSVYYKKGVLFAKHIAAVPKTDTTAAVAGYTIYCMVTKNSDSHGYLFAWKEADVTNGTATDFADADKTKMNAALNNHAVPYFNSGEVVPSVTTSNKDQTATVSYGKGDYSTAATLDYIDTLKNDGYDVNPTIILSKYDGIALNFTAEKRITEGDDAGARMTMKYETDLSTYSYYGSSGYKLADKGELTVTYIKPFKNASGTTTWNSEVSKDLKKVFGDDYASLVPYIYLASDDPTSSTYATNTEIDITGGTWDDQVIEEFTTVLDNDNTKRADEIAQEDSYAWTYMRNRHGKNVIMTACRNSAKGWITMELRKSSDKIALWAYLDAAD